jgi:hypothetical protein
MLSRSTIEDALLELLFALTAYTSDRVNLKKAKKFSLAKHAILEPIEEEKEVDEGKQIFLKLNVHMLLFT